MHVRVKAQSDLIKVCCRATAFRVARVVKRRASVVASGETATTLLFAVNGVEQMIETILPVGVTAAEAFVDVDEADAALLPEERVAVASALDRRRREYATVRFCAREALTSLGVPPTPIVPGASREPQWPGGVVGSMTHCDGYRGAAVARAREFISVGIDAEPNRPLPVGVLPRVVNINERQRFHDAAPADIAWDRLLFSAKEAVYKAWFPLAHRWLGFHDAEVVFEGPGSYGSFVARLLVPGPMVNGSVLTQLAGRWMATTQHLLTAVVLPRQ